LHATKVVTFLALPAAKTLSPENSMIFRAKMEMSKTYSSTIGVRDRF